MDQRHSLRILSNQKPQARAYSLSDSDEDSVRRSQSVPTSPSKRRRMAFGGSSFPHEGSTISPGAFSSSSSDSTPRSTPPKSVPQMSSVKSRPTGTTALVAAEMSSQITHSVAAPQEPAFNPPSTSVISSFGPSSNYITAKESSDTFPQYSSISTPSAIQPHPCPSSSKIPNTYSRSLRHRAPRK